MSAPSTRRLRDRSGVAEPKTATSQRPTKTQSPISALERNVKKPLSGKENPRPNSRTTQKPTIRSVPRVDKAAVAVASGGDSSEGRMRSSSVPRGRSSSPSEFIRVFRDDRGSKGENDNRTLLSAGKKSGSRGFRGAKENGVDLGKKNGACEGNDFKVLESGKNLSRSRALNGNCNAEFNLGSNLVKYSELVHLGNSSLDSKVSNSVKFDKSNVETSGSGSKAASHGSSDKSSGRSKVLENLKNKNSIDEDIGSRAGFKYPSKLHEKLAFLEGKVKRIASDIKRTKEMLEINNPDASKVILSDIQEKISGIEKAMGNVVAVDSSKKDENGFHERTLGTKKSMGQAGNSLRNCENGVGESSTGEKSEKLKVDDVRVSVKGMNIEELEARLLPHEKLLRNRTSLKVSTGSFQSHDESNVVEAATGVKVEEKVLSPIDKNPIAMEFLASLNKERTHVIVRDAKVGLESCEVQETDGAVVSGKQNSSNVSNGQSEEDLVLTTDETFDEFDDQENRPSIVIDKETEDTCLYEVNEIGTKSSTGGWFVSEGESVLLAHDDGSCSFYDIANCEEKAVYKPPAGISPNIWRDCWIIRAPSADGCSGRYVVAASAGNSLDSGFCSWDFYSKDVRAFHIEDEGSTTIRTVLGPLPNNTTYRNSLSSISLPESQQWWYRPCGPLIISTVSSQRVVKIFDIRDGEQIMKWDVQKPVLAMDYSSPLQWRNRGKAVVAEADTISVWDVNSLNSQSLLSISSSGRKISALHVINTDAELGGGVRQRVTSAEAEGNDGVFCTPDAVNVLDFRHPSGVALKIPKIGVSAQSVFTRGDSIFMGCANMRCAGKKQTCSQVQQFSLRKQRLVSTYSLPENNAHSHHSAITQVWGNSNTVMAVCGLGLFVFDALNEQSLTSDYGTTQKVKDIIGPDDLYSPSFDNLASRALLISRDRPAMWRHLP